MKDIIVAFSKTGARLNKFIHSNKISFYLVCNPNKSQIRRVEFFSKELKSRDMKVNGVIVNKLLPHEIQKEILEDKSGENLEFLRSRAHYEGVFLDLLPNIFRSEANLVNIIHVEESSTNRFDVSKGVHDIVQTFLSL